MPELLPILAQGGIIGAVIWALAAFHRSAVNAHKQRADEWQKAYAIEKTGRDEDRRQLYHLLSPLKDAAQSDIGSSI